MAEPVKDRVIMKLRDSNEYYGPFGKQFLSFSDIITLLKDPREFRKPKTPTTPMIMGSYLHSKILEPHMAAKYVVVDATPRNTKFYKESVAATKAPLLLLKKDQEHLDYLCDCRTQNMALCDIIYHKDNFFEEPGLTIIGDTTWKGRADIVNKERIVDIKTTASLDDFKRSCYKYNYDSQAFLYQKMFGVPMHFLVVEKNTGRTAFTEDGCSEVFLRSGEEKVYKALEIYNKFFSDNPTEDLEQFYINLQL